MSEKPHTVAIGAFIVGALLIALTTILFVLGSGFGDKEKIIMVFDGSVKGLNVGAPLALRGVPVGQVTKIELILDSDNVKLIMLVEADFHSKNIRRQGSVSGDLTEELIARGLRAQLNSQSLLTGLLYIQMDFHPGSDLNLADIDSPYFQFPTIPTDLERITKKLQDLDISKLTKDLEGVAKGLNTFVRSEEFQGMPASLKTTLDSLTGLSNQLQQQLATTGPKVDHVLDSANTELPRLSDMVARNLEALNDATTTFEKTLADIDGLVAYDSATIYRLNQALEELTRAGRAMQLLAKTLEEQPESLIRGKSGDK